MCIDTDATPSGEPADPSPAAAPSQPPAPSAATIEEAAMLSALSAPSMAVAVPPVLEAAAGDYDDIADNGSSSLSELGDASDDESEPTPRPTTALDMEDDDSEAETERLENTPRKLARTATDTSLTSDALHTRTPSKLMHSRTVDQDESAPPTPSVITDDVTLDEAADAENPLHSFSLIAASEASLDYAGKKRKRTSEERSTVEEQDEDEPARKRSASAKAPMTNGLLSSAADSAEQIDADEELEGAEERLSQLAQEEIDLEERQANLATEIVDELATVAKHAKPRKGGRRGKRKAEDSNHATDEQFTGLDAQEGEEDDHDEELSAALDEEVARKKKAIDDLVPIQAMFKIMKHKYVGCFRLLISNANFAKGPGRED